jgi:hypothetical protein
MVRRMKLNREVAQGWLLHINFKKTAFDDIDWI